ncbi:hypothetical protein D9756_009961 [Leucocoprinus leucothites]|uniref:J domain-containing protein n=1 Tax=Leucocoprinus leucothites TaxID=201217 RepID=A0A8H5CTW2_9AGAR|nr:hypothetical protein D9756_009961 [Leucoagaricus leucothites]
MPHNRHSKDKARNSDTDLESNVSLYEVLGVFRDASSEEIKRAYRKMVLEHHPDKNAEDRGGSTRRFNRIQEAYEILIDTQACILKRREYDLTQRQTRNSTNSFHVRTASHQTPSSTSERRSFSFTFTSSLDHSFAINLSSGSNVLWSFTSGGGRSQSSSSSVRGRTGYEVDEDSEESSDNGRRRCAYVLDEDGVQEYLT